MFGRAQRTLRDFISESSLSTDAIVGAEARENP